MFYDAKYINYNNKNKTKIKVIDIIKNNNINVPYYYK